MPEANQPMPHNAFGDRSSALTDAASDIVFETLSSQIVSSEPVTVTDYEEFFSGLYEVLSNLAGDAGRLARHAPPVVTSAIPGALWGSAAGAWFGPYGALIGALAGGTGSALQSRGRGAVRDIGIVISRIVGTAGALTGGGAGPGLAILLGSGEAAPEAAPEAWAWHETVAITEPTANSRRRCHV